MSESEETVSERVRRVFATFKKMPPDEITMETTFECCTIMASLARDLRVGRGI